MQAEQAARPEDASCAASFWHAGSILCSSFAITAPCTRAEGWHEPEAQLFKSTLA